MNKSAKIRVSASGLALVLFFIAIVLTVIHIALIISVPEFNASTKEGVQGLLNLNAEASIPTWYAQMLLFFAAVLLVFNSIVAKTHKKAWLALGFIFIFVSMDEGAAIHELTVFPVRDFLGIHSGPLYYSWVILYMVLFSLLVVMFFKFFISLPNKTKVLFALSAIIFLSGAVGFEMYSASIDAIHPESHPSISWAVAAEEFLEMTGAILFIYALLNNLKNKSIALEIRQ